MSIPKIVGIETEYGIALHRAVAPVGIAREFFETVFGDWIQWDGSTESRTKDARELLYTALPTSPEPNPPTAPESESPPLPEKGEQKKTERRIDLSIDQELSTILPNGARFYIDHAHPEYCTPECLTARELVAYDKAGEHLLMEIVQEFNKGRDPDHHVILYKNNSDHQGNSYGCHENYLISAPVYQDLFNNKSHWLYAYLLPYLVSRQVFCGAGKVGVERGSEKTDYQISQRADFIESVIGLQTTHNRPIINTRDEPHADATRFRRLHVICGDANLAEWSIYLKVGVTQLILAMLEADALKLENCVMLADPVAAFKTISRDPTLQATVELEHGQRKYSALHIQSVFVEAARRYLESDATAHATWHQLWQDWAQVIDWLENKPEALDGHLDWRIKRKFLQTQLDRKGLTWQSAFAREMDIRYHQLDSSKRGFFYLLRQNGRVTDLLNEEERKEAIAQPPATTRAYLRGQCVKKYHDQILSANWEGLTFMTGSGQQKRTIRLRLPNPTAYTESQIGSALEASESVEEMISGLMKKSTTRSNRLFSIIQG